MIITGSGRLIISAWRLGISVWPCNFTPCHRYGSTVRCMLLSVVVVVVAAQITYSCEAILHFFFF